MSQNLDKFESHYRQQLSALMDGELAPDEARFLLRRLSHDDELSGCWERWQICGDVLRGQACAPAPRDFGDRVARALAAEAVALPAVAAGGAASPRRPWLQWGGGAALAASVAAVAFMVGRSQVPTLPGTPPAADVVLAGDAPVTAHPAVPLATPATSAPAPSAVAVSVPPVPPASARVATTSRPDTVSRPVASRPVPVVAGSRPAPGMTAPVATVAASVVAEPVLRERPLVAEAQLPATRPFGVELAVPQARPWPRSVLPQYATAVGGFNASFEADAGSRAFYPFEPRTSGLTPAASMPFQVVPPGPDAASAPEQD